MSATGAPPFPAERPAGLEIVSFSAAWWRIDSTHPDDWDWRPAPCATERFDPPSCRFRVRYAASSPVAAARERYPTRQLSDGDGADWLVRLEGKFDAIDLTDVRTLDALGVDDRISTGRLDGADHDPLLACAQALADAVWDWWDGNPPAILYRTQSTPVARSLAFHQSPGHSPGHQGITWDSISARPVHTARALLHTLAGQYDFQVPDWPAGGPGEGPAPASVAGE